MLTYADECGNKVTEEAEAACHRLHTLFFVSCGFSPEDAAALLLCDLERLARYV
jgi:hypothetical protein